MKYPLRTHYPVFMKTYTGYSTDYMSSADVVISLDIMIETGTCKNMKDFNAFVQVQEKTSHRLITCINGVIGYLRLIHKYDYDKFMEFLEAVNECKTNNGFIKLLEFSDNIDKNPKSNPNLEYTDKVRKDIKEIQSIMRKGYYSIKYEEY